LDKYCRIIIPANADYKNLEVLNRLPLVRIEHYLHDEVSIR
jgi:hypothetical protein